MKCLAASGGPAFVLLIADVHGVTVLDSRKLDDVFLWAQVPGFHEQTRTQNVHALIAMFSGVLIDFFNGEFLFGMSSNDSFESAMRLHKSFEGVSFE